MLRRFVVLTLLTWFIFGRAGKGWLDHRIFHLIESILAQADADHVEEARWGLRAFLPLILVQLQLLLVPFLLAKRNMLLNLLRAYLFAANVADEGSRLFPHCHLTQQQLIVHD